MGTVDGERATCTLCGTPIGPADGSRSMPFCSDGCRAIHETLGASEAGTETRETDDGDGERTTERTFFRIDGMHAASCESFLESIAEAYDGVTDAAASYVTESVRVDHEPRVSTTDLRDALSVAGYTAYPRDEATGGDGGAGGSAGRTRRDREMSGMRKRRSDDLLEIRYIVGIVFGSFMLVPYVTIFYPVYLASFTDWWLLHRYEDAFTNLEGLLLVPVFVVVTGAVLYLTGMPLLRGAYVSLRLRRPNTRLLAALTIVSAFCYGTVAFVLGRNDVYYDLTILVAALVMGATFYEALVKRRALDRLTDLTVSQVDEARRLEADGSTATVDVADLDAGDRVLVREGERIPIDGVLAEGSCTVDEAIVTGDSLPVTKRPGDEVVGGSVVRSDAAVVAVGEETTSSIDRLTETVWNVQSADHGGQRHGDALAVLALPIVVAAVALVAAVQFANGASTTAALMAVLLAVVATSPWAIGFATQVSVGQHLQAALSRGIVVFDESVFERIRAVDTVVFDKTGTLTTGEMTVRESHAPDDLLRAAGALEARSAHPVATAIEAAFATGRESDDTRPDGGRIDRDALEIEAFRSHETGVEGVLDGDRVLVGHPELFADQGWSIDDAIAKRVVDARESGLLPVVVGREGRADGVIVVGDEPRDAWDETVSTLHGRGVEVVVLTGDHRAAADDFRDHPHVDHVFAGVSPAGKTAAIRRLCEDGCVAMVGDGTNDAPALAAADLGFGLGSGTALAADAADVAIVDDDLEAVDRAFEMATAARRRLRQNLGLALVYNAIVVPVAIAGLLNPLVTTAALVATALLVVGNGARPLLSA